MNMLKLMIIAIWKGLLEIWGWAIPSGYPPLTPAEAEEYEFLRMRSEWGTGMSQKEAVRYVELHEKAQAANGD